MAPYSESLGDDHVCFLVISRLPSGRLRLFFEQRFSTIQQFNDW